MVYGGVQVAVGQAGARFHFSVFPFAVFACQLFPNDAGVFSDALYVHKIKMF